MVILDYENETYFGKLYIFDFLVHMTGMSAKKYDILITSKIPVINHYICQHYHNIATIYLLCIFLNTCLKFNQRILILFVY